MLQTINVPASLDHWKISLKEVFVHGQVLNSRKYAFDPQIRQLHLNSNWKTIRNDFHDFSTFINFSMVAPRIYLFDLSNYHRISFFFKPY